jgi:hypothetical protein
MTIKTYQTKLRAGKFLIPVTIEEENNRLFFDFRYNAELLEEIKLMYGRKYHGYDTHNPRKVWSIPICPRNMFQLQYLAGQDPYKKFDEPLIPIVPTRPLRDYQCEMVAHGLTRHYCIFAAEMGLGKSLSAMEIMERSGASEWVWVGPGSALRGVELEFEKWKCMVRPQFYTYEGMKKLVNDWPAGKKAPQGVIFDESSRLKNPTAQRTQAAQHLADSIRQDWGDKGYVILMSGTPAPKSPADWWAQAEIACPGFLREGDLFKFREKLGVIVQKETAPGAGSYPHLETWRDNEAKCQKCGKLEDDIGHDHEAAVYGVKDAHKFVKSVNEVARLSNRLKGLVIVKLKKDCLSLPEKMYEMIKVKPLQSTLNAARLIKKAAPTTISALTLLRELSDGFQYEDYDIGTTECPLCKGAKVYKEWVDPTCPDEPVSDEAVNSGRCETRLNVCPSCSGVGEIIKTARQATEVPCPKDEVLKELLDKYVDVGRFVTYAGFQASVDRIVRLSHEMKWATIRVDGRGWLGQTPEGEIIPNKQLLKIFQYGQSDYEHVNFIGQPGAAGMGITLTASPAILYFSNPFDGEARIQSEDRIHRLGMDENRGATIYDIDHLPTDIFILDNLRKKRTLQDMSLGILDDLFAERV